MAVSWQDIRDEIIQEYGYLTTDSNLATKVFHWEKDAVRTIVNTYPWWWLQEQVATVATVSSQNYISLGVAGKVRKIFIPAEGNAEILPVDPESLIEQSYNLSLTGQPIYYWVTEWVAGSGTSAGAVKVQFYPIPDAIYSLRVLYLPFELGADVDGATVSNILPVPTNFVPCIKQFVRSKLSHIDGDIESASYHWQQYLYFLQAQVLEAQRFRTKRIRLRVSDIPDEDVSPMGPKLDPAHFS